MGKRQEAPAASVPAVDELVVKRGQADVTALSKTKLSEMLGLFPVVGTGKLRVALPSFSTVTVRGLSVLVAPTAVPENARLGISAKSSFFTALLPVSAT